MNFFDVYMKKFSGRWSLRNMKERKIYESVPGKQVSLSHIIANPDPRLLHKLGLMENKRTAIGIMTITPGEAAIIAVDIAKKAADIEIGFVDRFSGAVLITGEISAVEDALNAATHFLKTHLAFSVSQITRL